LIGLNPKRYTWKYKKYNIEERRTEKWL